MPVSGEGTGRAAGASVRRPVLRHEAVLYRGQEEYAAAVLAFVTEGLARGETVLVALPGAAGEVIRQGLASLDGQASRVAFVDMARLGRNPSRIASALWDLVDGLGGQPARFVGEPIWPGRSAAEIREAVAHEAMINLAFAASPLTVLCSYDTGRLPAEVTDTVARTHPVLRAGRLAWRSQEFGAAQVPGMTTEDLAPPPDGAYRLAYTTDLRGVRDFVARHAVSAGLGDDRAADLVLAAGEVAANTIAHTPGGGTLAVWQAGGEIICEVTDQGQIADPLVGQRRPAEARRLGLWVVHQLCDLVELRSGAAGTTVRMHMRRPVLPGREEA